MQKRPKKKDISDSKLEGERNVKLKVYDPKAPQEKEVYLKLVDHYWDDEVVLCAVDKHGDPVAAGNLLVISRSGVRFCSSINTSLGFDLTANQELRRRN